MKKTLFLLLSVLTIGLVAGCTSSQPTTSTNKTSDPQLQVTTSFYPMYYFATQIGGNYVSVTNLTPAGVEPHDYELTPQNFAAIQDSQLLILNGGQLEPWAGDVTTDLSDDTIVVEAGQDLTDRTMAADGAVLTDPHVWLSPKLAQAEVAAITTGFITADPTHAAEYTANSQALTDRLDQLDKKYTTGLAKCSTDTFITSHEAFSYLASGYNLVQKPIAGLSPEAEPSLNELAEITDFAKANNVQYIFFESLVSPKLSETIATEVGAQILVLNPLEGLTDEEIAAGQDYFTVMQNNLANLQTALQCQ